MREDINLKKLCLKISICCSIILMMALTIQIIFNGVIKYKGEQVSLPFVIDILVNFVIWMSAGVAASSFTIWFTKMFDYAAKKQDLLTDYFFTAYKLMNVCANIQPMINDADVGKIKKSYRNFDEKRDLWNELNHEFRKLNFSKKDSEVEKFVKAILDSFKDIVPKIIWNSTCIELYENDAVYIRHMKENDSVIFEIREAKCRKEDLQNPESYIIETVNEYWPTTETKILPNLKRLEQILFNEITLSDRMLPNAIISIDDDDNANSK